MDFQTSIGVIFTIIVGILGIYFSYHYYRDVSITFAFDQIISLTNDITQNFKDLIIFYKANPITQNLVLCKGFLINTGKKDITMEMVEQKITLELPDGFKWLECNIVKHSDVLKVNPRIHDKKKLLFDTGLWKSKELFKFEALAEVPYPHHDEIELPKENPSDRLKNNIAVKTRISDLKKIKTIDLDLGKPIDRKNVKKESINFAFKFSIVFSVFLAMKFLTPINVFDEQYIANSFSPFHYIIEENGKQLEITAMPKNNKVLLYHNNKQYKECTFSEFELVSKKLILPKSSGFDTIVYFALMTVIVIILLFSNHQVRYFRLYWLISKIK